MQKHSNKAFTLVELIVVITILAILGTIAFISLQGYSKQARDTRRVSDISNIKKSLELFSLNTGKYPIPDEAGIVAYSGETLFTQGIIGDNVTQNLSSNLQEKPLDPLHEIEYIYSTTNSRREYELLAFYEGENTLNISSQTHAANIYKNKISGNYNGIFVRNSNFIVPLPSIITSETLSYDLYDDTSKIRSQIISNGNNYPDIGIAGIEKTTGGLNINFAYTGVINDNSTDAEKISVLDTIQLAYNGSDLATIGIYANILGKITDEEKLTMVEDMVLNNASSGLDKTSTNESVILSGNDEYTKLLLSAEKYSNFNIGTSTAKFDGNGDYITIPGDGINIGTQISVGAWVNYESLPNTYPRIINQPQSGTTPTFSLLVIQSSKKLRWQIGSIPCDTDMVLEPNNWYNVVGTFDSDSDTMNVYINGDLVKSCSNTNTFVNSNNSIYISHYPGYTRYWDGYIDDVVIFDRVLNSTEIKDSYSRGVEKLGNNITNGLLAYFPFDEDVLDYSTNDYDGTISGDVVLEQGAKKIIDSSTINKNIFNYGDVDFDKINYKIGNTSMNFDGTGDYLTLPDSEDWDFGSENFTIDFWMNAVNLEHDDGIIAGGSSTVNGYAVAVHLGDKLVMYSDDGMLGIKTDTVVTTGNWSHYAIVRDGDFAQWYINGVPSGEKLDVSSKTFNSNGGIKIGRYLTETDNYYFNGQLDELRISKGIARTTDSNDYMYDPEGDGFTPPTQPYGN